MRLAAAMLVWSLLVTPAKAQIFARPYRPSPAVLNEVDAAGRKQLDRARQFLADKQWAAAVEAIRLLGERNAGKLLAAEGQGSDAEFLRYQPAGRFVQDELRRWIETAPEAAAVYRELTDRRAAELVGQGSVAQVVEQFAATTVADEAFVRLGDAAVERGELMRARDAYRAVTDTSPRFASAARRMVYVSLLEGDFERARREAARLPKGEPPGGDNFSLAVLQELEKSAADWRPPPLPAQGSTFAVDAARQGRTAGAAFELGAKPRWSVKLPRVSSDREVIGTARPRLADEMQSLQVYYPLVCGDDVLVRSDHGGVSSLIAYALADGSERWRQDQEFVLPEETGRSESPDLISDAHRGLARHWGTVRYTLTAHGPFAFARMGSPVTAPAERRLPRLQARDQGSLLAVDLYAEGKPAEGFPVFPDGPEWAFEGPPLVADGRMYVAMTKREGTRRALHVACYERLTTPVGVVDERGDGRSRGRMLWRTAIATGDTVGGGDLDELSHTLLARQDRLLFVSTNLGAVAAIEDDGAVRWLARYPRAPFTAEPAPGKDESYFRELTPPVIHRGKAIFAPVDCEQVFALDAMTGAFAWSLPPATAADSVHLLGAADGTLITSGRGVNWIDVESGKVIAGFKGDGLGRGCLRGDQVLFPTRQSLFVFPLRPEPGEAKPATKFNLSARGASGGNLVAAPGTLLIATGTELIAFDLVELASGGR